MCPLFPLSACTTLFIGFDAGQSRDYAREPANPSRNTIIIRIALLRFDIGCALNDVTGTTRKSNRGPVLERVPLCNVVVST